MKNGFLLIGFMCLVIGVCVANICTSMTTRCANYSRLAKIEEGFVIPPSYQTADEIGVEMEELPPPGPLLL